MNGSPMARRLAVFRSHKRGLWSLRGFLAVFLLTLFAELIANDKPLVVYFDGGVYFPFARSVAETEFGGNFDTEADYQDPFVRSLIASKGWILNPPIPYSYDTIVYDIKGPAPTPPDADNLLGTDDQGRDVLARLIYGLRISILFALCLTVVSVLLGVTLGSLQGYLGGLTDLIGQRLVETWGGLPVLFLLIVISSIIAPNFWWLLVIMGLFSWMPVEAVVRAEFLRARNMEYVLAAKALGVPPFRLLTTHILPNAMVATLTFLPFIMSGAVTALTSLDFLGFGLPHGSPSLGEMLAQAKANLNAYWLGITIFVTLAGLLSMLVFVGEAVRDAFDPRLGGGR